MKAYGFKPNMTEVQIATELMKMYQKLTDIQRNKYVYKLLLAAIEKATGKTISGKDSEEVIAGFGELLADTNAVNTIAEKS